MLSRKYYQQIAEVLAEAVSECRSYEDKETIIFINEWVIDPLSQLFEQDNPSFDSERFSQACGYRGEVSS